MGQTNPNGVRFDDVYKPENDHFDSPALARAVLISAKHDHPEKIKPLID